MENRIKVKNTKNKLVSGDTDFVNVLVTEGKLILVEGKETDKILLFYNRTTKGLYLSPIDNTEHVLINPIIISEDEVNVERGSSFYNSKTKTIFLQNMWENMQIFPKETESKILALPEHFSKEHLQDIVDEELKDGDKVLLECELKYPYLLVAKRDKSWIQIKLNSYDHIIIHKWYDIDRLKRFKEKYPKEVEKMYTRDEVKQIVRDWEQYMHDYPNSGRNGEFMLLERWFKEKNQII